MDPGRYGRQQGWDNNSALEGYVAAHEPNNRVGGSYDDRRYPDERYSRPDGYSRSSFNRDFMDRDNYPPSGASGIWTQSRRRSHEDEYAIDRDSRRHDRQYVDSYHEIGSYQENDKFREGYRSIDNYPDRGFNRHTKFTGRAHDDHGYDDYDHRHQFSREDSREGDYEYGRHSYDSDYDKGGRRDGSRRHNSYDQEREKRTLSRERDQSPHRRHERSRSRSRSHSHGHDDLLRSRSPRGRSRSRSQREDSYEYYRYERSDKRRDREEKRESRIYSAAPSATIVVKGLSQKTTEEDLYQILAEWGPLRHVRIIKERSSGISRGFAFVDFPSVDAASTMMEKVGNDSLVVDGRELFFEYSSKPTEGAAGSYGMESSGKYGYAGHRSVTLPADWMCTICDCVNFARRTSCFQCNEPRSDDAPPADVASSNLTSFGKKGFESGPTHVLVVRGLDENADEEMLRYEFSKHAAIKDLRLIRDKFTHVSRGFAFVHFHSVEDATRALEATNGTTLEKNGQVLRVQYAKSIVGPGSGGPSQSSSLAAAAIEAATFAQQYDAVGWAPKEYNPDEKQTNSGQDQGVTAGEAVVQNNNSAPQSGFVWDEASGYYYDAASGFYYDGNTGLYYDCNSGIWYSYDNESQQYIPFTDQTDKTPGIQSGNLKTSNDSKSRKVVISAPAATITTAENATSLSDAVQAAANAALAAEKKEKEKSKEIKVASKSIILANKKKMNNVLTMWKQRSHEGQATRVVLEDNQSSVSADDRHFAAGQLASSKPKADPIVSRENMVSPAGAGTISQTAYPSAIDSHVKASTDSNRSGGSLMGVIRGSGRGASYSGAPSANPVSTSAASAMRSSVNADTTMVGNPFKTDLSALGSYNPPVSSATGKRRFSETPSISSQRETPQTNTIYRDRAAERRSLYGSFSSITNDDDGFRDSNPDVAVKWSSLDSMPFPPGVGGGRGAGDGTSSSRNYEVITADKAIDENNVGNRMLRSMGWHEGSGLGKDGSGMIEPVQAQSVDRRAGLGSQQKKLSDPSLEVQAGDSYKTLIQKKALARFREMS